MIDIQMDVWTWEKLMLLAPYRGGINTEHISLCAQTSTKF